MTDLRFPIGEFKDPGPLSAHACIQAIDDIATTPQNLRDAVSGLSDTQLDTPYRPDGWTVRQVVHHLPDSHTNSYIRFKRALTEDVPTVRTYFEDRFARLPDYAAPIGPSLELLDALHRRWVALLRDIPQADWSRGLNHPEMGPMRLDNLLALYAWHGPHHIAHITSLRAREGW